jgi:hypothetical protein
MPTIAEILAAKKAAAAAPKVSNDTTAAPAAPKESLAERVALKESIDRIDPPGKSERAAAARKTAGIILSKDLPPGENRGQATPVRGPEDIEPRSLSETHLQAVPVVPVDADAATVAWHAALNAFDSELCLMTDPTDPERAWLAVRVAGQETLPVLLHALPFYQHPRTVRPDLEPF